MKHAPPELPWGQDSPLVYSEVGHEHNDALCESQFYHWHRALRLNLLRLILIGIRMWLSRIRRT